MNVRILRKHALECISTQIGPWFLLVSERVGWDWK